LNMSNGESVILKTIKTFMLDLDGTFYLGDRLFPWSLDFIAELKRLGKQYIFVTNNSSHHATYYAQKISAMGLPARPEEVFTSGEATIYHLRKRGFAPRVYLVGTPDLEAEFRAAGYELTMENPAAVVLGFDLTLTYPKLQTACTLVREGVPFIATHPDFNCPTPNGPIPDCGAMIACITAATGIQPQIIGKPHPAMVEALCAKFALKPSEVAMIGDRLYTDIAMGKAAGVKTILVLSGETTQAELAVSTHRPDLVAGDLGVVAGWLREI
jgi:4-nitrophenyl phosphatase